MGIFLRLERFAIAGCCVFAFICGAREFVSAAPAKLPTYSSGGIEYVSLWEFMGRYLPAGQFKVTGKTVTVTAPGQTFSVTMENRVAEINGTRVWLSAPATSIRGRAMIPKADAANVLLPLWSSDGATGQSKIRRIVIDPGHGGDDDGTRGRSSGVREKALTLAIALRVEKLLAREGFEVTLTRRTDKFISLERRTEIAKSARADLFISIHLNAADDRSVAGIETFCLPSEGTGPTAMSPSDRNGGRFAGHANDPENFLLAYQLQTKLLSATGSTDRGVRRARFAVLREADCPAALLELGFLSNAAEEKLLRTSSHQDTLAEAIADAIVRYRALKDKAASSGRERVAGQ